MVWSNKVILVEEVGGNDNELRHRPRPDLNNTWASRGGGVTSLHGEAGPPSLREEESTAATPAKEERGGR